MLNAATIDETDEREAEPDVGITDLDTQMTEEVASRESSPGFVVPHDRPEMVEGATRKVSTGCGSLYVTINRDELGFIELFSAMGKGGGCAGALNEAIGRLVSLCLRSGVDPIEVARQLSGIRCPSPCWKDGKQILSCADAVARALKKELEVEPEPAAEPTT